MRSLKPFLLALLFLSLAGCDGNEPTDPRLAFEGRFELENVQFSLLDTIINEDTTYVNFDTTLTVSGNPRLFFERVEGSTRSMTLDANELVEHVLVAMWEMVGQTIFTVDPEFSRLPIAVVAGHELEVEDTRFRTQVSSQGESATLPWDRFSGSGTLQGDALDFEFSMFTNIGDETIEIEGSASGLKRDT